MTDTLEERRLQALYRRNILDTPPSESLDRITRMAATIFDLPVSAISLTDRNRQWFMARVGVEHDTIARDKAPCAAVSVSAAPVVIHDLLDDACYATSTLANQGIRFYAGVPLTTSEGFTLGALCVLGVEPRAATDREMSALSDLAAMVMAQIEYQHTLGRTDPLTGLPNRLQFVEDFDGLSARQPDGRRRLAVLIDLARPDELQRLMHVLGPSQVDTLIREAAEMVRRNVDRGSTLYHVSATQFVMIADAGVDEAGFLARVRRKRVDGSNLAGNRFAASWSIGIAPFVPGVTPASDLLRMAAIAVEDAGQTESRVSLFSRERDALQQRRFRILTDFRQALERTDQLRLVFQPRIDLATGRLRGVEALLRWTHPELGEISPGEFIPVIEQTSLARETTAWVLDQALRQHAIWRALGLDIGLSVNISARNLREPAFVAEIRDVLAAYAMDSASLELEVTESAVMTNGAEARARLESLAELGVRIAIDDFGTGYSSFSYLHRLPAHVVKIDRSFITDLDRDTRTAGLVKAMITLSHDLGYTVVAEGVETVEVEAVLRSMGCDEVQGYYYARPLEAEKLLSWKMAYDDRESATAAAA